MKVETVRKKKLRTPASNKLNLNADRDLCGEILTVSKILKQSTNPVNGVARRLQNLLIIEMNNNMRTVQSEPSTFASLLFD